MALGCMEHRGACSADNDSGDGSGLMTLIPWEVIEEDVGPLNRETTGYASALICSQCNTLEGHTLCTQMP